MSKRDAFILKAASIWTLWVWGTRILNILQDEGRSFSFKAAHVALALVSVAFAVAIWTVASRNRARTPAGGLS